MNDKLLWGVWFIWAMALLAYCLSWEARWDVLNLLLQSAPIIISSLFILFFIRYLPADKGLNMFKRKETSNENMDPATIKPEEDISVASLLDKDETLSPAVVTEQEITIVPSSCHIKGEIEATGDIHISGSVTGTITAEKTVHILSKGKVEGDIYAEKVVVDGKVTGTCASDAVEINANGFIDGTIASDNLSINKNGHFYGVSKPREAHCAARNNPSAQTVNYNDKAMVRDAPGHFTLIPHGINSKQEDAAS